MNPYETPSSSAAVRSISPVAIGILAAGTIGLSSIAAILCGLSCYLEIGGNMDSDFVPTVLMFGVPLLLPAFIGIPAGTIHLRRKSKLDPIPTYVYGIALCALVGASVLGNPLNRWFSIFLICCIASIVIPIRTAVRYQRAFGE